MTLNLKHLPAKVSFLKTPKDTCKSTPNRPLPVHICLFWTAVPWQEGSLAARLRNPGGPMGVAGDLVVADRRR
jgi:hypothetical protein